jgi:hypothetical protein
MFRESRCSASRKPKMRRSPRRGTRGGRSEYGDHGTETPRRRLRELIVQHHAMERKAAVAAFDITAQGKRSALTNVARRQPSRKARLVSSWGNVSTASTRRATRDYILNDKAICDATTTTARCGSGGRVWALRRRPFERQRRQYGQEPRKVACSVRRMSVASSPCCSRDVPRRKLPTTWMACCRGSAARWVQEGPPALK